MFLDGEGQFDQIFPRGPTRPSRQRPRRVTQHRRIDLRDQFGVGAVGHRKTAQNGRRCAQTLAEPSTHVADLLPKVAGTLAEHGQVPARRAGQQQQAGLPRVANRDMVLVTKRHRR